MSNFVRAAEGAATNTTASDAFHKSVREQKQDCCASKSAAGLVETNCTAEVFAQKKKRFAKGLYIFEATRESHGTFASNGVCNWALPYVSMRDSASSSILHDTSSTRAQPHLHFDYAVNGFVGSVNGACAHSNAYRLLPIRALQAYCCCWQSHCATDNLKSPVALFY